MPSAALFIGINYTHSRAPLKGCVNDIQSMAHIWKRHNPHQRITILCDDTPTGGWGTELLPTVENAKPTAENIRGQLHALAQWARAQPEPVHCWLYYSGHGSQVRDMDEDELDGKDECLVALDRVPITDDELKQTLVRQLPATSTLCCIFDACNSGSMLDLPHQYGTSYVKTRYLEGPGPVVFTLSGCRDSQQSADVHYVSRARGALSQALTQNYASSPTPSCQDLQRHLLHRFQQQHLPQRAEINGSMQFQDDTPFPLFAQISKPPPRTYDGGGAPRMNQQ